jgi:hypothetical protein
MGGNVGCWSPAPRCRATAKLATSAPRNATDARWARRSEQAEERRWGKKRNQWQGGRRC